MKKVLLLLSFIAVSFCMNAQVTTNGGSGLSPTYSSLAAAITALNAATITSPVTITLTGNETAPVGGYSITATGTSTNTITIIGSSSTITAPTPQTSGNLNDAIFKIIGGDYITIQNFAMQENAANTTTAALTNNMTEWGVALLYASTTNGAQNCTILNNAISLNRTYQNTFGIYSNSSHTATAVTSTATATTTAGGNSGLKIYGNAISNVNNGICVVGPTAAADHNNGVDIGGTSVTTGNTISNYGTTGTFSGYFNVSGSVNGILVRNSIGVNISYNSITSSNGGTIAGTLRAIFMPAFNNAPSATTAGTINNNTISLTHGVSATLQGISVEATTGNATSSMTVNNNNFTSLTSFVASSGTFTGILYAMPNLTSTISNNTFTNITTNTTGSFTFISHSYTMPASGTQTLNNNSIVTGFTKTGAGGTVTCFTTGTSSPNGSTSTVTNNNFSNINVTGATAITGVTNSDGSSSSPTKICTGNTFNSWTGGTSAITGISYTYIGATTSNISTNTFTNITGQAAITGINIGSSFNGATTLNVASNTINNLSSTGTGGAVTGISCTNTSTTININNNAINTLSSTGAAAVVGVSIGGATTTNVYKNLIYDLSGSNASSTVNGILVSGGTTLNVYNNLVGDLRATTANAANPLIGFNITGGTTINAYYNSIWLNATSSGPVFGSSAVSASTTPTVNLRNNIFVNGSTSNTTGLSVAYRRSSATLTSYASTSNNNLFYAALIYNDGTNSDASISAFKTRMSTRDQNSVSENPTFQSTTGSSPNFLKFNTATPTQIESGAANIATFTDDYAATARFGNPGSTSLGTAPDMGAWELDGAPAVAMTYVSSTTEQITGSAYANSTNQSIIRVKVVTSGALTPLSVTSLTLNANGTTAISDINASTAKVYYTGGSTTFGTGTLFGSTTPTIADFVVTGTQALAQGDNYFWLAYDVASGATGGNTIDGECTSITVGSAQTPTVTAPAGSKTILGPLANNYNVGAGQVYTTLTAAITDLNLRGVSAAVTFTLTDAAYAGGETYPLTINSVTGASASNTITIKPSLANTTITGSSASAIFVLNGADYITIDGSTGSTANTVCPVSVATRDLTITNTNSGTSSAVVWLQTAADGATNNTIKNCNLVGSSNTQTLFGVGSGSSTISTSSLGTGNNSNSYINNNISKTQIGIFSQGASISNKNTGTVINQNLINSVSPNNVQIGGIRVGFESGAVISGNNIANLTSSGSSNYAIALGVVPANTYVTLTGNEVVGAEVSKNMIDNIVRSGDGSSYGIVVAQTTSVSAATNVISNNMISGVRTTGATPKDSPFGIEIGGGTGATNVYNNTVVMTGVGSSSSNCFGIAIGGSNPVVDLRNNIIVNKMTSTSGKMFALGLAYTTYTNLTSNNNNLFTTAGVSYADVAVGGFETPTTTYALAAWVTAASKDGLSKNIDPTFISASNLHIDNTVSTNLALNNAAATGTGITDDIDCGARGSFPDIGADQFGAPGFWVGTTSTDWGTTTNWDDAAVPTSGANITVPTGASNMPVLDAARTVGTLALGTSTTLGLNGQTFTINGLVSGSGTLTGSAASSLSIVGAAGTLNFTSGSRILKDLMLAASATATLGTALDITGGASAGTVTIGDGGTLTTGGNLTLKSDENGTARIAQLNTGAISGNVAQERFIPAKASRTYSLVASPFTQSISSAWQQQVHITGAGTGGGVCPTPTAHSNGFDATTTNAASMFVYDGTKAVGSRWTSVTGTTGVNLTAGTGYRMNIRGPRSLGCSLLDGSVSSVTAATLSSSGALNNTNKNYGSFSINLMNNADASGSNDNYLLTGNPYPSQVLFSSLQAANSGVIANSYAIYAPGNAIGNYAFWNGALGTWSGASTGLSDATGNIIANGQAFFVKGSVAGADISLGWTEAMKTPLVNNGNFRQMNNTNRLRIGYQLANGNRADEIMIMFADNVNNEKLSSEDVVSINSGAQHLKSIKAGSGLAFNARNINFIMDTVHLNVVSTANGTFKLSFYDFDGFVSGTNAKIFLVDHFTGTTQLMNDNKEYSFTVNTANAASQGASRFSVVFSKPAPLPVIIPVSSIKAYPNPVAESLTIELPVVDGGWTLLVVDMNGKVIMQQQATAGTTRIKTAKLASGTYTLQAVDASGKKQVQKLVKQ